MMTLEEARKHESGNTLIWARSHAGNTAVRVNLSELTYDEGIQSLKDYARRPTTNAKNAEFVYRWMKQEYEKIISQIHKPFRREVLAKTLYEIDAPHATIPDDLIDTQYLHNITWEAALTEIKNKYRERAERCLKAIGE